MGVGVAALDVVGDVHAQRHLCGSDQAHFASPNRCISQVHAHEQQVGRIRPTGKPGLDEVVSVLLQYGTIGFLDQHAVEAGEHVVSL